MAAPHEEIGRSPEARADNSANGRDSRDKSALSVVRRFQSLDGNTEFLVVLYVRLERCDVAVEFTLKAS